MTESLLVPKLIARQGGRSDRNFARVLGVSVSRWCEVKAGASPGLRFLRGVVQAYPDLALDCAGLFFSKPERREKEGEGEVAPPRTKRGRPGLSLPEEDSMLSDTASKLEVPA